MKAHLLSASRNTRDSSSVLCFVPIQSLTRWFSPAVRQRGDEYFTNGSVRSIEIDRSGVIEARVVGTTEYHVFLSESRQTLSVRCDCPHFEDRGEPCKHIWATLREAYRRNLIQASISTIEVDDIGMEIPEAPAPPRLRLVTESKPSTSSWMRLFDALPRNASKPFARQRELPAEIAYSVASSAYSHAASLTISVIGRSEKKPGVWGKWKPAVITFDQIEQLTPFDREVIALLAGHVYGPLTPEHFMIRSEIASWWIEKLARAGKLMLTESRDEHVPVQWSDERSELRVSIVHDVPAAAYRIEGALLRGDVEFPLDQVRLVAPGVIILDCEASRLDGAENLPWLQALRKEGQVTVPETDKERFRQALLKAPPAKVTLPEDLGWDVVEVPPRPILSLRQNEWSTELEAQLFFQYERWRITPRSEDSHLVDGRRLIRRDIAREQGYRGRLLTLPFTTGWSDFRLRIAYFDQVARTLIDEGWTVELNSAPVRFADDYDVAITEGIDWFDLNATAVFGGQRVSLPEILEALRKKSAFIPLTDGSVGVVPREWADEMAPLADFGTEAGPAVRFKNSQALVLDAILRAREIDGGGALGDIRRRITEATPEPVTESSSFLGELRPYQRAGLGWLVFLRNTGVNGCLADDMGLGKTVQVLALLESIRGKAERPTLIVAPRSLLFNWIAEAKHFAPDLRILEHHGTDRMMESETLSEYDVVLTTYGTMRVDIEHLAAVEWEYVILDESQAIKNASSQSAKAVRLLNARHRLALSGTPIENHLGELWSLFEFLNPGMLGSSRAFQRTFAGKTVPADRREALARALRPLILRRTKEQVAPELPERIEQTLWCELEGRQRRQYDELREFYRQSILGTVQTRGLARSKMQILEALLRLRQAACHPGLIDGRTDTDSAKVELLFEELKDVIESGHRALVFSQFTSFLDIVRRELDEKKIAYSYLDGKTRNRDQVVKEFQKEDGPPLFLISLKAGGLGLNLTSADYVFLLDPWWNPAVEAQAIDRAHRIGQTQSVFAYRLIARDTVEEKILELQSRKKELAEAIITEDNSVLRKLEIEDLELLLS